jgi:DNA-binding transcriptional LysR family regulator
MQALFRDRNIVVARQDHPLCGRPLAAESYASARHVLVADREFDVLPVDEAVEKLGLTRNIAAVVGGFSEALSLVRGTDLLATVPERFTSNLRDGLAGFAFPMPLEEFTVSLLWHPRMDADPVHRWLRECIRDVCRVTIRGQRAGEEIDAEAGPSRQGKPARVAEADVPAARKSRAAVRAG